MRKLYGDAIRKDAGVTKTLRNVAARNAGVLGGVTRGVKEVQGTFEKVFEETADAVEEFLNRCSYLSIHGLDKSTDDVALSLSAGPRIQGYVDDTKILLKQSGERFVIRFVALLPAPFTSLSVDHVFLCRDSRVTNDLRAYDQSKYQISLRPSLFRPTVPHASTSSAPVRFHLGEAITIDWKAPGNHSTKDWIGIYRLGANASKLVTRVSSQGKWIGVCDKDTAEVIDKSSSGSEGPQEGSVTFEEKKLAWKTGLYEFRFVGLCISLSRVLTQTTDERLGILDTITTGSTMLWHSPTPSKYLVSHVHIFKPSLLY